MHVIVPPGCGPGSVFNVADNGLGVDGALEMAGLMAENNTITELNMSRNMLGYQNQDGVRA